MTHLAPALCRRYPLAFGLVSIITGWALVVVPGVFILDVHGYLAANALALAGVVLGGGFVVWTAGRA